MTTTVSRDAVLGDATHFDDGRVVFVGKHKDHPDLWFVAFRSKNGEDTKLTLSPEAMAALVTMVSGFPPELRQVFPPPPDADQTMRWVFVPNETHIGSST